MLPPIIDPHVHFWDLGREYYGWLQDEPLPHNPAGDLSAIAHRNYLPEEYRADTAGFDVRGAVHVEAGLPDHRRLAEARWLTALAAATGLPSAIVAGATLDRPGLEAVLEALTALPLVRGVRQILNFHPDPRKTYTDHDRLRSPAFAQGFALLGRFGLHFDLQIYPAQMPAAAALAARHPETLLILNHAGMATDRDPDGIAAWYRNIETLAALPNLRVKISGLGMVDRAWTEDSIRPFIRHLIDCFSPARAMFASNFPVDRVHGSFGAHFTAFDRITADLSPGARAQLFAGTATETYRIV